jgi:hypothetical protein
LIFSFWDFLSLCLPFFLDSLVFSILFMLSWASQHHGWVFPLLPVLWYSSVCWLIFDNGLDWLLVGDEVQGMDVTIAGHYHKFCYWKSLNLHVPVTSVQSAAQFFLCFWFWSLLFSLFGDILVDLKAMWLFY